MGSSFLRTLTWLGGIFGAVCALLYLLVFDTWVVPGNDPLLVMSVAPTLLAEDRILTRRGSEPRIGNLVRCGSPGVGVSEYVVGRVMGTGGDLVEIRNERILVNGKPPLQSRHGCPPVTVLHPLSGQQVRLSCQVEDTGGWTYQYLVGADFPESGRTARVGPGKLFLVSDNRHLHMDSRDFGQVEASTCEHIVFRLWGDSFVDTTRRFSLLY